MMWMNVNVAVFCFMSCKAGVVALVCFRHTNVSRVFPNI